MQGEKHGEQIRVAGRPPSSECDRGLRSAPETGPDSPAPSLAGASAPPPPSPPAQSIRHRTSHITHRSGFPFVAMRLFISRLQIVQKSLV